MGLSQELTDNLIGQIGTTDVKEELKRTTQEALDLGVSGVGLACTCSLQDNMLLTHVAMWRA